MKMIKEKVMTSSTNNNNNNIKQKASSSMMSPDVHALIKCIRNNGLVRIDNVLSSNNSNNSNNNAAAAAVAAADELRTYLIDLKENVV